MNSMSPEISQILDLLLDFRIIYKNLFLRGLLSSFLETHTQGVREVKLRANPINSEIRANLFQPIMFAFILYLTPVSYTNSNPNSLETGKNQGSFSYPTNQLNTCTFGLAYENFRNTSAISLFHFWCIKLVCT